MQSKKPIKLHFADFWPSFSPEEDAVFAQLISSHDILLDKDSPDYVIFSVFGFTHLNYDCIKIFYTGENQAPDFNLCDYAIGFDYIEFGDRYIRFPLYSWEQNELQMATSPIEDVSSILHEKTGFCNFVYSNKKASPARDEFFKLLSNYKRVDSPGQQLNNMTSAIAQPTGTSTARLSKIDFQSNYKFSIAFENACSPGYSTEKIIHAFAAKTVPIYWGDPTIAQQFNPDSFINCHDFDNLESVIANVIEMDNDNESYLEMLCTPCFESGVVPKQLTTKHLFTFFDNIFNQPLEQARRRSRYGCQEYYREHMTVVGKAISKRQGRGLPARLRRFLWR